jgi:hypothetical protein
VPTREPAVEIDAVTHRDAGAGADPTATTAATAATSATASTTTGSGATHRSIAATTTATRGGAQKLVEHRIFARTGSRLLCRCAPRLVEQRRVCLPQLLHHLSDSIDAAQLPEAA